MTTYSTSTTGSAGTTGASATATTACGRTPALGAVGAFSVMWLRLARKLDRDLAVEDILAVELLNSALGLVGCGEVHEGVANGAGRAWVGRDGG